MKTIPRNPTPSGVGQEGFKGRECYGYLENPMAVEVRPKTGNAYYAVINKNTGYVYFDFDTPFDFEFNYHGDQPRGS